MVGALHGRGAATLSGLCLFTFLPPFLVLVVLGLLCGCSLWAGSSWRAPRCSWSRARVCWEWNGMARIQLHD